MNNELMNIETIDPVQIFEQDGLEALLEKIRSQALSIVADAKTPKGRAIMASTGHWVARSKTALDGFGKSLNAERDKKTKLVNRGRKQARDFLDGVKQDVLKPKVEWEAAEAESARIKTEKEAVRVKSIETLIEKMASMVLNIATKSVSDISDVLDELYETEVTEKDFAEFTDNALRTQERGIDVAEKQLTIAKRLEAEAAERKAEAARLEKQREEQGAEQARLDKVKADQKAEQDRIATEKQKIEDDKRKIKEAQDRKEFRLKAAETAKIEAERAEASRIENERARAAKAKALLPDKEKAAGYINTLLAVTMPTVDSDEMASLIVDLHVKLLSITGDAMEALRRLS